MTLADASSVPPAQPEAERSGLAATAYDRLLEMLLNRRLDASSHLTERGLAAELGVSRTPLREALRRLEGEGLLERRPDGALSVRRLDVEEFLEVLQVRRLLEVEAAGLAAGAIPALVLAALRERVRRLAESGDPQSAERLALDLELHHAIGGACGNRTLAASIEDLRRRTLLFATRKVPERLGPVCDEHLAILHALETGNGAAARLAMAAHIDNTRAGLLRRLMGG